MQETKIGFSWGLTATVLLLASCLGFIGVGLVGLNYLLHLQAQKQCCVCCPTCKCVDCKCKVGTPSLIRPKGSFEPVRTGTPLPEVNERARDEVKQGGPCPTGMCPLVNQQPNYQPNVSLVQGSSYQHAAKLASSYGATVVTTRHTDGRPLTYASLRNGLVWASTGVANTKGYIGASEQSYFQLAVEMQQGTRAQAGPRPMPSQPGVPQRIATTDRPTQAKERSQITLFLLPNDPLSARVETWFRTDPTLSAWRTGCTFQVYTPDNKLYQTLRTSDGKRTLAEQVPVSEFPSVVITAPDGGHIHAAGKNFIPETASEFVSDVWKGFEHHKQRPALHSGMLRTSGYSWDNSIAPSMRLNNLDCPDGNCPLQPRTPRYPVDDSSRWVPGKIANDMFAKPKEGMVKDLAWGWLEYAIIGAVAVLIVVGTFALILVGGFVLLVLHLVKGSR